MSESLLKLFGSVKIVQEVSQSASSSTTSPKLNGERNEMAIQHQKLTFSYTNKLNKRKRRNSLYALNQLRKIKQLKQLQPYTHHLSSYQQNSYIQIYSHKNKSQKLLCLWPLPTITRYTIFISFIISTLKYFGFFNIVCSSPSFVIYKYEITNLILSPFLFSPTIPSILLYAVNVLLLGLFEESLTHMLGGQYFLKIFIHIILSVSTVRQGIGYLFSKSTGWAVPSLFFSDSMHECNQGLAPFLFALLVIQSINLEDKYIFMYGKDEQVTVRKVILQTVMCLVNYTIKDIMWWSLAGLITGFITAIIIQTWLAQRIRWDEAVEEKSPCDMTKGKYRPMPLWHTLQESLKKSFSVIAIVTAILVIFNGYYTREKFVDAATLNEISQDQYLFTFVIMTAPRRGDPPFLTKTLDSYVQNWPENPQLGTLYGRIQTIVYTHFTNHLEFDRAKAIFGYTQRGKKYIRWVREEGSTVDQRRHVSKALGIAAGNFQSTYIALVEDDFPVCGIKEWKNIESVVYAANKESPNHCGVFVGTGGSGLFLKPKIAKLASTLLLKYTDLPPDIIIQQCLLGNLDECQECAHTLVTSKTLLMYHIGYNTSTSIDRSYKKNEFQCGWRHPFNGDPNVKTL